MPQQSRFALNFSGSGTVGQARYVTELLAQLDPSEHAVRARLQAILVSAHVFIDPSEAATCADAALTDAQRAGDDVSRAWALIAASIADVSPQGVHRRLADTAEVLRIAQETGEWEFVPTAYFLHLGALADLGMLSDIDRALSPTGDFLIAFPWLAGERHVAWFRCLRATIDGQAEVAERIADDALQLALQSSDPDAHSVWVGQLAIIRWMQGRVVELEPAFLHARQASPHEPVWAVSLAWMWLRQGRRSAARSLIAALPAFADLPVDRNWLSTACILAIAAAELDETELAAAVGAALAPFEDRLVTIGLGVTCWGTVSRPLALVARALGDVEGAIRHYRRAIDTAGRIGAHPWLAEAQVELAAMLADQRAHGSRREAFELASEAAATGRALNLHSIEPAASRLLDRLNDVDAVHPDAMPSSATGSRPRIDVLGAFEVIAPDGTIARWQSRKARQLLKILVSRRGVAISRDTLMHLLWPDEAPQKVSNRFSVAATTVRRALDPHREFPSDTYLQVHGSVVSLRVDRIDIDLERFLAETARSLSALPLTSVAAGRMRATLELHRGDAFADEPEESWAEQARGEVHAAFFAAAHALAEASHARGDVLTRLDCYRSILAIDGYDQRAHEGLIDAMESMGAHGQAAVARESYGRRMEEIDIAVDPSAPWPPESESRA